MANNTLISSELAKKEIEEYLKDKISFISLNEYPMQLTDKLKQALKLQPKFTLSEPVDCSSDGIPNNLKHIILLNINDFALENFTTLSSSFPLNLKLNRKTQLDSILQSINSANKMIMQVFEMFPDMKLSNELKLDCDKQVVKTLYMTRRLELQLPSSVPDYAPQLAQILEALSSIFDKYSKVKLQFTDRFIKYNGKQYPLMFARVYKDKTMTEKYMAVIPKTESFDKELFLRLQSKINLIE